MYMNRKGGYVQSARATIERACEHCEWHAVGDTHPELAKRYQDHLREDHPRAWLRS